MPATARRRAMVFFIAFGVGLVALAIALNVGWILISWRDVGMLLFGIIVFGVIIAGLILNTIFLVREIRRNEQHDAFINAVTHELKTPIASIRLYLETLLQRQVPEERRREFYRMMLSDSDRLLHTVEQVLQASRVRAKDKGINRVSVDLGELAAECVRLARSYHRVDETAIRYVDEHPAYDRPLVMGDPQELQTAVLNLLDNAVKYSPSPPQIEVRVATDDGSILLHVQDNGAGVPRSQHKVIFRRFYRVPGRRALQVKGTGLGLYIVRSIADRHGGSVQVESAGEGKGSTFTLRLPSGKL